MFNPFDVLTNKKIGLLLTGCVLAFMSTGCGTAYNANAKYEKSPCDEKCMAEITCNELNVIFVNNQDSFKYAKRGNKNELTRKFCEWHKGLVIPTKDTWLNMLSPKEKQAAMISITESKLK